MLNGGQNRLPTGLSFPLKTIKWNTDSTDKTDLHGFLK